MKLISLWAKQHPSLAITIIVFLKISMGIAAFYLGQLLAEEGLLIPAYSVYLLATIFLVTIYIYPSYKTSYFFRKATDWVMMSCAFITVVAVSNNINSLKINTPFVQAAYNVKPPAKKTISSSVNDSKNILTKLEKKNMRKALLKRGKFLSAFSLGVDPNAKKRTTAIVLIVLLALVAGFFLSGLVCTLSCNGSDAAAVIVGVAGLAGIIWGASLLIKSTNKKYPATADPPSNQMQQE